MEPLQTEVKRRTSSFESTFRQAGEVRPLDVYAALAERPPVLPPGVEYPVDPLDERLQVGRDFPDCFDRHVDVERRGDTDVSVLACCLYRQKRD